MLPSSRGGGGGGRSSALCAFVFLAYLGPVLAERPKELEQKPEQKIQKYRAKLQAATAAAAASKPDATQLKPIPGEAASAELLANDEAPSLVSISTSDTSSAPHLAEPVAKDELALASSTALVVVHPQLSDEVEPLLEQSEPVQKSDDPGMAKMGEAASVVSTSITDSPSAPAEPLAKDDLAPDSSLAVVNANAPLSNEIDPLLEEPKPGQKSDDPGMAKMGEAASVLGVSITDSPSAPAEPLAKGELALDSSLASVAAHLPPSDEVDSLLKKYEPIQKNDGMAKTGEATSVVSISITDSPLAPHLAEPLAKDKLALTSSKALVVVHPQLSDEVESLLEKSEPIQKSDDPGMAKTGEGASVVSISITNSPSAPDVAEALPKDDIASDSSLAVVNADAPLSDKVDSLLELTNAGQNSNNQGGDDLPDGMWRQGSVQAVFSDELQVKRKGIFKKRRERVRRVNLTIECTGVLLVHLPSLQLSQMPRNMLPLPQDAPSASRSCWQAEKSKPKFQNELNKLGQEGLCAMNWELREWLDWLDHPFAFCVDEGAITACILQAETTSRYRCIRKRVFTQDVIDLDATKILTYTAKMKDPEIMTLEEAREARTALEENVAELEAQLAKLEAAVGLRPREG